MVIRTRQHSGPSLGRRPMGEQAVDKQPFRRFVPLLLLGAFAFPAFARDVSREQKLLAENGIEVTQDSLHEFFVSMNPGGDIVVKTKALVAKLDDDEFRIREDATNQLLRIPQIPLDVLQKAAKDGNPEVRWRCGLVLAQSRSRSRALLMAALRVIEHGGTTGLCQDIIDCVHHFKGSSNLEKQARSAFLASVAESDQELLRSLAASEDPELRVYSVRGLTKLFGRKASNDLRPFLKDSDDRVRIEAASLLANNGDRDALRSLVKSLESKELNIRARAVQLLRRFTDQKFRFVAYGPQVERAKAIEAWREWIDSNLEEAELNTNVALDRIRIGRILVCFYNTNRVVEFDESHKVVWEMGVESGIDQPWGCQGLPNGHRLITFFNQRKVIEYDETGEQVWEATVSGNPAMASRLENGNTLVSLYSNNQVIELTPEKKIAGVPLRTNGSVAFAERTEHGHTLVALAGSGGVVEYDSGGLKLESYPGRRAFSVRTLETGNLLIADSSGGVKEYSSPKTAVGRGKRAETVWSHPIGTAYDAVRMDNGNTLIAHEGGLTEVDSSGKTVWTETTKGSAIRVSYY